MNTNINVEGFNNLSPEVQQSAELIRKGYLLEEWRPGRYYRKETGFVENLDFIEVSRSGKVRYSFNKIERTIHYRDGQYPKVTTTVNMKRGYYLAHVLLCSTYYKIPDKLGYVVHHKNGNKNDFSLTNLEFVTNSFNTLGENRAEYSIDNVLVGLNNEEIIKIIYTKNLTTNKKYDITKRVSSKDPSYLGIKNWVIFREDCFNKVFKELKIDFKELIRTDWVYIFSKKLNDYYISKFGIVKTMRSGRTPYFTLGSKKDNNYYSLSLLDRVNDCTENNEFIHRIVYKIFICKNEEEIEKFNKSLVDHIDTNPENNNYNNLRLVDNKENMLNELTMRKKTKPIKCINGEGKIVYFSSRRSAGLYFGVNPQRICDLIDSGEEFCGFTNFTDLEENLLLKYRNNLIDLDFLK